MNDCEVAVWVGDPPRDDEAALATYDALVEELERDESAPPNPALVRFADELLGEYPDFEEGVMRGEEVSPWAEVPLKETIAGDLLHFGVVWSLAEEVFPDIVRRATANGLVCFDPLSGELCTPPAKPTGQAKRRGLFRRR